MNIDIDSDIKDEIKYVKFVCTIENDPDTSSILRLIDILNTKSANLLQHVSIMIAILSVFFAMSKLSTDGNDIFLALLLIEITAYMAIALGCIRISWVTGPTNAINKDIKQFTKELHRIHKSRRKTHKNCVRVTWVVTFFFVLTIWWRYYSLVTI